SVLLLDVSNPQAASPVGQRLMDQQLKGQDGAVDDVNSVAFSADGKILASAGNAVRLWDVSNPHAVTAIGQPLTEYVDTVLPSDFLVRLAFSPVGKLLASTYPDGTIRLWDVSNPHAVTAIGQPLIDHTRDPNYITAVPVAFSPDGKTLASAGQ